MYLLPLSEKAPPSKGSAVDRPVDISRLDLRVGQIISVKKVWGEIVVVMVTFVICKPFTHFTAR